MATYVKPNGNPEHREVVWSPQLKVAAGVLAAWIVAGGTASIGAFIRLAVVERVVHDHVQSVGPGTMHEGPDAKRQRIRDEIEHYHERDRRPEVNR